MGNDRAYIVTYLGDGVVSLPSVGMFQNGTRAWVDAETADRALRMGHCVVTGPDGATVGGRIVDEMAPPAPPAPPAPVAQAVPVAPAPAPAAAEAAAPPAETAAAPAAPAPKPRRSR